MAYIKTPKNLNKIKARLIFNLTKRQLICFGSAAAVSLPVYFAAREPFGNTTAALLLIIIASPLFLLAMFERDGLPAEKILMNIIRVMFLRPHKRLYKAKNSKKVGGRKSGT